MAITVEFDGRFRKKISNVSPSDLLLRGKQLFVKGVQIPVMTDRLYDLFYLLEERTSYKHGKICVVLCANGDIKYHSKISNFTADYYVGKVMNFGTIPDYKELHRTYGKYGPTDDEYRVGGQDDEFGRPL